MTPYGVLLVTSNHLSWPGLEALLRRERELCVLDPVHAVDEAVHAAHAHHPTFILVAADLEDTPLVALIEALHTRSPQSKVIIFGLALGHAEQVRLLHLRVAGHVCWEEVSPERVRHILALVRDADVWVASRAVAERLAPPDRRRRPREQGLILTERERTVMRGLAAGRTRVQIATDAHLGLRTVKRTIAVLCAQFDAPTMFVLGTKAVQHGFVLAGHDRWPEGAMQRGKLTPSGHKVGPKNPLQPALPRCIVEPR